MQSYNPQKQNLDVAGPLASLWAALLNWSATINPRMSSYFYRVHARKQAIQLPVIPCSYVYICQRQEEQTYPSEDGQQNDNAICELNGGCSTVFIRLAIQL